MHSACIYTLVDFDISYFYDLDQVYLNSHKTYLSSECLTTIISNLVQGLLASTVTSHGWFKQCLGNWSLSYGKVLCYISDRVHQMLSWKTTNKRDQCSPLGITCVLKKKTIQLPSSTIYFFYRYFKGPMGNEVPMVSAITSEELLVRNILGPSYYYQVFASFTGDLSRVPATTSQRCLVRPLGLALLCVIQIFSF